MVAGTGERQAARGALEGVLFADRMIIESCVSPDQGPVLLSGAFGSDVAVPQLLADMLDKDIRVVDEGHLPSIGAAAMAVETLEGHAVPAPSSRLVHPRASWRDGRRGAVAALPGALAARGRPPAPRAAAHPARPHPGRLTPSREELVVTHRTCTSPAP